MSDQGRLPDRRDPPDFGLIETLLWTRDGGFDLLPEHLARLAASSAALGFRHDPAKIDGALAAAIAPFGEAGETASPPHRLRVRLVLSRDGEIETGATPIDPVPAGAVWRVALARRRFASGDPMLRHKTTRRALYEDELAQATLREGADEVLFLNERAEICESARCNFFLPRGDGLLTPALSSGLLPGTLRARLISVGPARAASARLDGVEGDVPLGPPAPGQLRTQPLA
jgi:branched-subunit amino acid aminotransferase/4-amino-4-deoxychorismate lyase